MNQSHAHKLTAASARAIIADSGKLREIAERHGVSTTTIKNVRSGRSWPYLPRPYAPSAYRHSVVVDRRWITIRQDYISILRAVAVSSASTVRLLAEQIINQALDRGAFSDEERAGWRRMRRYP